MCSIWNRQSVLLSFCEVTPSCANCARLMLQDSSLGYVGHEPAFNWFCPKIGYLPMKIGSTILWNKLIISPHCPPRSENVSFVVGLLKKDLFTDAGDIPEYNQTLHDDTSCSIGILSNHQSINQMETPWEDPQFHGGRTLRGQGLQSLDLLHPDSSSLVHDDSVFLWKVFTLSAWWLSPTPLKNDGVKVSWDDCSIPKIWKNKSHVPNHQPANGFTHG